MCTRHWFRDTYYVPGATSGRSQGRAWASLHITPSLCLENNVVVDCGCRSLSFCVIHRECDSVVIDDSGDNFANCSWPSGLWPPAFPEEETCFALIGLQAWCGRAGRYPTPLFSPSPCSRENKPRGRPQALKYFTTGLASPFLPLCALLFPFIKMKGVLDLCRHRAWGGAGVCE